MGWFRESRLGRTRELSPACVCCHNLCYFWTCLGLCSGPLMRLGLARKGIRGEENPQTRGSRTPNKRCSVSN
jgi:hypothetical protein